MDYSRNAKYFRPKPSLKPVIICAIIGLICFKIHILAALLFIAIAVILALPFFGRPTEQDIDQQALELFGEIRAHALKKLGLEEEEVTMATPIELWGYQLPAKNAVDENGKPLYSAVQGSDGVWRSPTVTLTAFYFSENTVHFYEWSKSIVSNPSSESTDEIYYKDIVSVKTLAEDKQAYDLNGNILQGQTIHFDTFAIRNMGGESISCSVRESGVAEEAVKGMRALLKTKKEA